MAELVTAVVLLNNGVDVSKSERAFEALGFEAEPVIGGSLLISGSVELFENKFGVTIRNEATGHFVEGSQDVSRAFAKESFPEGVRDLVNAIEFEAPPDFGPSDF
ncbi:MAG: hypothetical protein ACSHWS_15990 [Sulfitobacter sp.]